MYLVLHTYECFLYCGVELHKLCFSLTRTELEDLYIVCNMSASVLKRLVPKMPEVQYLKAFTDVSLCAVSKIAEIASSGMMRPCETVTIILDELGKCVLSWLKELWVVGGSSDREHTHAVGGKKELEASLCHILLILVSSSQTYGHFAHTHFAISLPRSVGYFFTPNSY